MPELSEVLAAFRGTGYVVAPAGYGKTHLIAASVAHAQRRQLVLTHTYAGVNALRRKMRALKVPDASFRIDTIASWALRLCLSYRQASHWVTGRPDPTQWTDLYRACTNLLDCAFIRKIVRASYDGMYVDEYQDCSAAQHEIVLKLARDLPCRIVGDPLQGIFDFDGAPVDWDRQIVQTFEALGTLRIPHRWNKLGSEMLGGWLRDVRDALEHNQDIDLTRRCDRLKVHLVENDASRLLLQQRNTCRSVRRDHNDNVIAIHKGEPSYKGKCHHLARQLQGLYSSIEEIEGKDLFSFVRKMELAPDPSFRLKHAAALAHAVMSGVKSNLPAPILRGQPVAIRAKTRNPDVVRAANTLLSQPTSSNVVTFLLAVRAIAGVHMARGDLFNRVVGVLRKHAVSPHLSLAEAAEKYQTQFRFRGRPIGSRRLIGTTLLVKGLEFHHAIVLDATSLSKKELYVALTRGSKSLTVISASGVLRPSN